jgi:hypothetical protein
LNLSKNGGLTGFDFTSFFCLLLDINSAINPQQWPASFGAIHDFQQPHCLCLGHDKSIFACARRSFLASAVEFVCFDFDDATFETKNHATSTLFLKYCSEVKMAFCPRARSARRT